MDFLDNLYFRFIALVIDNTGGSAADAANAAADATATAESGGLLAVIPQVLLWGGMIAALYFFLIRPQRKRDKQQAEMQAALKAGDSVITSGGLYGKIVSVGTDAFVIEFGDNRGIRVPIRKSDVLGVKTPDMAPPNREPMTIEDKKEDKKDEK